MKLLNSILNTIPETFWVIAILWTLVVVVVTMYYQRQRWLRLEKHVTKPQLFERYQNKLLGNVGLNRLKDFAKGSLIKCQHILAPSTLGNNKLNAWPNKEAEKIIVANDTTQPFGSTRCPALERGILNGQALFLKVENTNEVGLSSSLVESVATQIELILQNEPLTLGLINYLCDSESRPIRIWACIPDAKITEVQEVDHFMESLVKRLKRTFPIISLACEFYLANDLQDLLKSNYCLVYHTDHPKNPIHSLPPSAEYAIARSIALLKLSQGEVLDIAENSLKRSIPDDVVESRFNTCFPSGSLDISNWRCMAISGPPGSGKTDLAYHLAELLHKEQKLLVVALNTEGSLATLDYIVWRKSKLEARQAILLALKKIIPPIKQDNTSWQDGFSDAFFEIVQKHPERLVFLLDDLLPRGNLEETLKRNLDQSSHSTPRLVLVGRPKLRFLSENQCTHITCENWNRDESAKILSFWDSTSQAEMTLRSGPVKSQKQFSTYHLRVLKQFAKKDAKDSENAKDSASYIYQLEHMVKPMKQTLSEWKRPPEEDLAAVLRLIEQEVPHAQILKELEGFKEVDYVELLGRISWQSKYEAEDVFRLGETILNSHQLVKWASTHFPDESVAEEFLKVGAEIGIFKEQRNGARWIDNFIADGFAAHYLGHLMKDRSLQDGTIAHMVNKLNERQSLGIIPFALKDTQIIDIVRAVIDQPKDAKPDFFATLEALLSDDTLVKGISGISDRLINELLRMPEETDFSKIAMRGYAFARLSEDNEQAMLLSEQIFPRDTTSARMVRAALAYQAQPQSEFFKKVDAHKLDKIESADTAFWFANLEDPSFTNRILELAKDKVPLEDLIRLWKSWCAKRSPEILADDLFIVLKPSEIPIETVTKLVTILLEEIATKNYRYKSNEFRLGIRAIDQSLLVKAIHGQVQLNRPNLVQKLVSLLGASIEPEICLPLQDDFWVVSGAATVALQSSPKLAASFDTIAHTFRNIDHRFTLPESVEIKGSPASSEKPELVADLLPDGFFQREKLPLGTLKCWDGRIVRPVTQDEMRTVQRCDVDSKQFDSKFYWRVKMKIR